MLFLAQRAQDCPRRCAITTNNLYWQADQFNQPWLYVCKVQSLDNPDARSQQRMMGRSPILEESPDREVIDPDRLYLLFRQVLRRLSRNIHEILDKIIRLPAPR